MDTNAAGMAEPIDFRHHLTADGGRICARMICRTLDLIANKWAVPIILTLAAARQQRPDRPMRFSELSRALPLITQKELTKQLRSLEAAGLVGRHVHAAVPPRVEYWLTDLGVSLRPVLDALGRWSAENGPAMAANLQQKQDAVAAAE
ncbi:winged helix-turn-helix transcriptional regulator [Ferrovibrio xuzhouensis]|uniref:Winged helix-turn-helix transcriptional regulator n=1 Tax=Ferrovibrio xuzhouensis TaxID=1576914 RepID=A0ABV7VEM8_9PROT